jgi:peptide/nickel transport system substrate-binding protein
LKGGEKVKNRIISISLAVVLILSVGLIGCGSEQVPEITEYNLTISSTEGGSVTTPGEGTGSFTYDEGEVVDIVAEAEEGYHFDNWTGDVGTVANVNNAATTISMSSHCSITANFGYGPAIPLKNPGSFVQMTIGDVDSLDPAWLYDTASGEQVGYIYETLLFYDGEETDEFVPVLATEWELLDDNVTYRFKIRGGVKFHEGGDLTPEDVEYSFERAMIQDRSGGPAWMLYQSLLGLGTLYGSGSRDGDGNIVVTFDQIDDAIEVDGDWVVFHLVDPAWGLPFLQILCGPWAPTALVDKEWCIANGEWDGSEETWEDYNNPYREDSYLYDHTNGTGPWKLEEWDPGVEIKLVRNDNYWREPAVFERVITQQVDEWTTRKEALLAGDADIVYVPRAYIGELEGIEGFTVYQALPELVVYAFLFNMNVASNSSFVGSGALDGNGIPTDFFADIHVRKGFCYAFDYQTFIEDAFLDEAQQVGSPVCEGLPYFNPDASMYSHDLIKAEEHLKLAWDGEVWEKGFKFTLLYNVGNVPRETACKILAENLCVINPKFQVSIQPMDWRTGIFPGIKSGVVPMFPIGWMADYPHPDNFVVPFMASYGLWADFQGYGYPELDQLIEGAFGELDPAVQQDVYYEIQERYYEDPPSIMLAQPLGRRYFTKYIHGFYFNPMISGQAGPLYYMSKSES